MSKNFFDETHDFQRFIVENIYVVGNYQILSQQLQVKSKEKKSIIDILALDKVEKRITILELKNENLSDKGIWQPITYYDLINRGSEDLIKILKKNNINYNDINLNPKVLLVVPEASEQLLRAISYLENIDILVVEIKKTIKNNMIDIQKKYLKPIKKTNIEEKSNIHIKENKPTTLDEYLSLGLNREKFNLAKQTIEQIKFFLKKKNFEFDIFFNYSNILIMKNKKPFSSIKITNRKNHHSLLVSFKTEKEFSKFEFSYMPQILKYKVIKNGFEILIIDKLHNDFLEKHT